MKEYRVKEASGSEEAEEIMNEMARDGWEVKAVTYKLFTGLIVTFERETQRQM